MNPLCRLQPVRPICHKPAPKVALARPSFNAARVHPFAVRLKSSTQHLSSLEGHSYKTPVTTPTAHSASQTFEKVLNPPTKPAVTPTPKSIEQQVYGIPLKDPYTPMTIDSRYPDWLKKDIEFANSLEIPLGSEKLHLSVWDFPSEDNDPRFPLFYKRMVAADKYAEDLFLNGCIILEEKEK